MAPSISISRTVTVKLRRSFLPPPSRPLRTRTAMAPTSRRPRYYIETIYNLDAYYSTPCEGRQGQERTSGSIGFLPAEGQKVRDEIPCLRFREALRIHRGSGDSRLDGPQPVLRRAGLHRFVVGERSGGRDHGVGGGTVSVSGGPVARPAAPVVH